MKHILWVMKSRKKIFFSIFFSNFRTRVCSGYRWNWPMIWVSFESSRPDLVKKRVKSLKSRLFKKKFWDSAKLFPFKDSIMEFLDSRSAFMGTFSSYRTYKTLYINFFPFLSFCFPFTLLFQQINKHPNNWKHLLTDSCCRLRVRLSFNFGLPLVVLDGKRLKGNVVSLVLSIKTVCFCNYCIIK